MDKSPEAFRTISEVADFLETPAHVLRFWESRFPQIRPVKRAGGRRYYRPGDVALLAGIKKLLHDEGMTIRGVQKILREQGIRHVASLGSGDAQVSLPESDIEAVLSSEYGPQPSQVRDERPSAEALQSAQIISLESALNRQDTPRGLVAEQPDLWPPSPPDTPQDDLPAWPGDPGDAVAGPLQDGSLTADEDATVEPTLGEAPTEDAVVQREVANDETWAKDGETHGAAVDLQGDAGTGAAAADPVETGPGFPEGQPEGAAESTHQAAVSPPEAMEEEPTVTVAALLRRMPRNGAGSIQTELARLRDRLIDLRGRVHEAARRRAK